MDDKFYIKKFIRDDGETLAFDQTEIYLDEDNTLLVRPNPDTSSVNYTEANGAEMIQQQTHTFSQEIQGLLIPKATPYWTLVTRLTTFFRINHTYKIIYARKNGKLFAVDGAWISESLQVPPRPEEDYTRWSVVFEIGQEAWREYDENAAGQEIYANTIILPLLSGAQGGEVWDNVGLEADDVGEVWEGGEGGAQSVHISSSDTVYPVWIVKGECQNPVLQNNTTDEAATFNGTVAAGQTLTVDFRTGVAYLDGALATRYVSGLISCKPGDNVIGFNSDGGSTDSCEISWNNTIG